MAKDVSLIDEIVALAKRRGFVFQSSEIYGGLNGFLTTDRLEWNSARI